VQKEKFIKKQLCTRINYYAIIMPYVWPILLSSNFFIYDFNLLPLAVLTCYNVALSFKFIEPQFFGQIQI
jgi:hypothetical protein